MLVCTGSGARPGVFDYFGHGTVPYHPFYHPQSGLILLRATEEAARYFVGQGGCYVAAPELQDADR